MTIIDKRRGGGEASDMAQQAAQRAIDTNVPDHIKTGVRITGITILSGHAVQIPHKLNRVPQGWHVLRIVGVDSVMGVSEVSSDSKIITIVRPSGGTSPLVYDFWIF